MDYIERLIGTKLSSNKTIIITTSDVKAQILRYRADNQIIDNIKIMTEHEFESAFIFSSDFKLLNHLINNNPWSSAKLETAIAIQLEKALFIIANLDIKSHPLYSYAQQIYELGYLKQTKRLPNYNIISHLPKPNDLIECFIDSQFKIAAKCPAQVIKYNYLIDEIEDALEYILELVDSGVEISNIHLLAPNNYHTHIKQIANLYQLPVKSEYKLNILSHPDGKNCLEHLITNTEIDLTQIEPLLVPAIIEIVNKYSQVDKSQYLGLIAHDFNHQSVVISSNPGIELKSTIDSLYTNYSLENDYFILLGNYQDGLVSYASDTNIVSDKFRKNLATTDVYNQIADSNLYAIISKAKNVRLSYASKLVDKKVSLANNLSGAKVIKPQLRSQSKYSYHIDNLRFAKANYIKHTFNMETTEYTNLNDHFQIELKSNKFKPISRSYEQLKLSYTSINDYYKCSYKFYLAHILRIKNGKFDERKVVVGNIVHYVLENIDNISDLTKENILKIIETYISENAIPSSKLDYIYFTKFSLYLEAVCTYMKQEERDCGYSTIERERQFEMNLTENIRLMGKIDKILSKIEGDNLFVEIYDYKTGSLTIDISGVEYGLNMQNLIYFLLLKDYYKHESGEEVLIGTFQHQIKQKVLYDQDELLDTMRIKGFSQIKHENLFKRTEKIISDDQIEMVLNQTEEKVMQAAIDINNNKFEINPKIIKGKNQSCSYCPYASICNKSTDDFKYLN